MNIGIDGNFLIFEQAGVGKYSQNLLKGLFEIDQKTCLAGRQDHFFLYFNFLRKRSQRKKLIRELLYPVPKNITIKISSLPARWKEFLSGTPFPFAKLIRDPLDVFFSPYASGIPKNGFPKRRQFSTKMVVTVHDLVFMRFPEHRGRGLSNYYLKRHKIAVESCQKIIVPSQSTKKDLQDFLNVSAKKIVVIPEAVDREKFKIIKDSKKIREVTGHYFDPNIRYILSVGTLEPRKNLPKLVEAYSMLSNALQRKYCLVLVGGKGWNNRELLRTIDNLNLKGKVLLVGFVKDEDLPYIYNGAEVFVYPSLYEGFGLPPLEAMACGVPVVCSNISSLPEVVGKAGIYVNPRNEEEIAEAIKKIISDSKLAQKMIAKGLMRSKKFSWEKAAQETLKVLKSV